MGRSRGVDRRNPSAKKPKPEPRIYVSRPLQRDNGMEANREIRLFADEVGEAIKGTGDIRTIGSMAVTLMEASEFNKVRGRISARDRSRLNNNLIDFMGRMEESLLRDAQPEVFAIKGLALYGRNSRGRGPGSWTTIGFEGITAGNQPLQRDLNTIRAHFSDNNLPEPALNASKLHITLGRAQLDRISSGHGNKDWKNIFIPAGVTIPLQADLRLPKVELVDGL